jgi:hypothetical protein
MVSNAARSWHSRAIREHLRQHLISRRGLDQNGTCVGASSRMARAFAGVPSVREH